MEDDDEVIDFTDEALGEPDIAEDIVVVEAGNSWLLIVLFTIVVGGVAAAWHFGYFKKKDGEEGEEIKEKGKKKKKKGKKGHTTAKARVSKSMHTAYPAETRSYQSRKRCTDGFVWHLKRCTNCLQSTCQTKFKTTLTCTPPPLSPSLFNSNV